MCIFFGQAHLAPQALWNFTHPASFTSWAGFNACFFDKTFGQARTPIQFAFRWRTAVGWSIFSTFAYYDYYVWILSTGVWVALRLATSFLTLTNEYTKFRKTEKKISKYCLNTGFHNFFPNSQKNRGNLWDVCFGRMQFAPTRWWQAFCLLWHSLFPARLAMTLVVAATIIYYIMTLTMADVEAELLNTNAEMCGITAKSMFVQIQHPHP